MDLSCIISSGDLELYVLGVLAPEEAYRVEQLALLFPEVRAEIDAISAALEDMASLSEQTPSAAVKESLMARLAQLKQEEEGGTARVVPLVTDIPAGEEQASPAVSVRRSASWSMAAALAGLVVCMSIITFLVFNNRRQRVEVARLQQVVDTLNRNYTAQQGQLLAWQQTVRLMHNTDYRKITLAAVPGKPAAVADVFWQPRTGEVFVMDVSLPAAPAGRQYQLWAIVNGRPVDAGMLRDTKMQVQQMKAFAQADAFAITLEKSGGSPTPTMSALYVMGKTS